MLAFVKVVTMDQSNGTFYYPGYSYQNVIPQYSPDQYEAIFRAQLEVEKYKAKRAIDAEARLYEKQASAKIEESKQEKAEERRRESRMERISEYIEIFSDKDCRFFYRIHSDKRKTPLKVLFDYSVTNLQLCKIVNQSGNRSVYELKWQKNGVKSHLIKSARDFSAETLVSLLEKAGLRFLISRERKQEAGEALFEWLKKNQRVCILPDYHGWCKDKNGFWQFYGWDCTTWEEVRTD